MDVKHLGIMTVVVLILSLQAPSLRAKPFHPPVPRESRVALQSAFDRVQIGDTTGAMTILRRFLDEYPWHERAIRQYFQLAGQRRPDTAYARALRAHFSSMENSNPNLFLTLVDRGSLTLSLRHGLLRWAVGRFSESPEVWARYLRTSRKVGVDTAVKSRSEQLITDFPRAGSIVAFYAQWYENKGRWEIAQRLYHRLTAIQPGLAKGYRGLARYYEKRGQSDRARRYRARARALASR